MDQLQAENSQRKKSKRRPAEKLVVSLSDPEAALGWDKQKVFRPLYNVQLLNDVDSPFVLGYKVLAQVNDAGLMKDMLHNQRELLGRQVKELLADSGYAAGADLAAAEAATVTVYAPWQENDYSEQRQKGKKGKQMDKSKFTWKEEEDAYHCPEGKRLDYAGEISQRRETSGKVTLKLYQAKGEDCQRCQRRQQCTELREGAVGKQKRTRGVDRGVESKDADEARQGAVPAEEAGRREVERGLQATSKVEGLQRSRAAAGKRRGGPDGLRQ